MTPTILYNPPSSTLPPLAFATPTPTPGLLMRRRRERAVNEPPPLLKRKRVSPLPGAAATAAADAAFLPISTGLPFLDCDNFCSNGNEHTLARDSAVLRPLPRRVLPKLRLSPRTTKSDRGYFLPLALSFDDEEDQELTHCNCKPEKNMTRLAVSPNNQHDNWTKNVEEACASPSTPSVTNEDSLERASSSKSFHGLISKRSSTDMTRSLSLQFNLSLKNIAVTATNSGSVNSLIHIQGSSSSQDMANTMGDSQQNKDSNHRRSPVAATLDYLATAMRLPDVAIGLSI